jgi:hypothetical protein
MSFSDFSVWEVVMMVCFGFSWPFAIVKTIRAKNPAGKSYLFLCLIIIGYAAGCVHKHIHKMDWVYALYIINALMVATDMCLCLYYQKRLEKQSEKEG